MTHHRHYSEVHDYGYASLSRLTSAAVTGGLANYSESYGYNAATGNLETKGGLTLAYNDANHAHAVTEAGGNAYDYDLNGNQVTRTIGGSAYTLGYDAENRLVSVSGPSLSAQFTYDGDGRRVKSVINGVTTTFVGNHYEMTGGTVTKYYFAGGSRVAMRKNGTLYCLLSDHLGSTSLTTDANGVKIAGLRYSAWGSVRYSDGATPTKYTYTGQYSHMGEFGLMFFNARWLDPSVGRFAQADSIIPEVSQGVQAWDRYAFVNNNPTVYRDSSGHMVDDGEGGGNILGDLTTLRASREAQASREAKNAKRFNPPNVTERASSGDIYAIIDLLIPTHSGLRGQVEISIPVVEAGGVSFACGFNVVYNRFSDQLAANVDLSAEPGAGLGGGVSATVGPLVGWGSSNVNDVTYGYSGILSGTAAGGPAISAAINAPLDGTSITQLSGFHVDPVYGQIPATIYVGGGAGVAYAGIGGGVTGSTPIWVDLSSLLPWH